MRAAADDAPPCLHLEAVTKRFGGHLAVDAVDLDLRSDEFFCLLGPSGCGKTTLLRMIAGFETPSSGAIRLGDDDLTRLPPHRRPVNMMFQSYALFPHLSVAANVGYGLDGLDRRAREARVAELLASVRLDGFGPRRPDTLSGGQRQRVALARALARAPKLLLLDEPLGALDRGLREETRGTLRGLQRRLGTGFIVVTHDPEEAMMLADRIGVMDRGQLIQVGPPRELYRRPTNRFVAGLLGDVNLIPGRIGLEGVDGTWGVETAHGPVRATAPPAPLPAGSRVVVAVRPENLTLGRHGLMGTLADATFLGDRIRRTIRMPDGSTLCASEPPRKDVALTVGSDAHAAFEPEHAVILPA